MFPDIFYEHGPVKQHRGVKMISQADACYLLKRAVEYDRLMKLEADPTWQTVYRVMRDLWLEMANEETMSAQEPAREVVAIEQMRGLVRQREYAAGVG